MRWALAQSAVLAIACATGWPLRVHAQDSVPVGRPTVRQPRPGWLPLSRSRKWRSRAIPASTPNPRIALTLQIAEGQLYRVAGISFRNNRAISNSTALRSLFTVKDGEVFDKAVVVNGLEGVWYAYGEFGYLNANLVPDTRIDDAEQSISLVVDIDEGKQFFVKDIRVMGLDSGRSDSLLRDFPLQRGSVHNQRLAELFFNNSIVRLPAGVSRFFQNSARH